MRLPVQTDKLADDTKRKNDEVVWPEAIPNKQEDSTKKTTEPESAVAFPHYKRVSDYLLGACIGEGSFAKVRVGFHCPTEEKVAVKIINKDKAKKDSYVYRNLHREGKLMQQMRHPNIVQVYDILETSNNYYLVTELCTGGELIEIVSEKGFLPEETVRKYMFQLVNAVAYLHERNIVHRDLKVENLLLDHDDNIKVIDFGLSNSVPRAYGDIACSLSTQCGSPAYAAPELLAKKTYGSKVDVWSIGVITYALLAGKLPFTVEPFHIQKLCKKMLRGEMNPMPNHTTAFCRLFIRKLLQPDYVQRPAIAEVQKLRWISTYRQVKTTPHKTPTTSLIIDRISSDITVGRRFSSATAASIDSAVVKEMCTDFGFSAVDVLQFIHKNRPGPALATYYLLIKKRAAEKLVKQTAAQCNSSAKIHTASPAEKLKQASGGPLPQVLIHTLSDKRLDDTDETASGESPFAGECDEFSANEQESSAIYDGGSICKNRPTSPHAETTTVEKKLSKEFQIPDTRDTERSENERAIKFSETTVSVQKAASNSKQTKKKTVIQSEQLKRSRTSPANALGMPLKVSEMKDIVSTMWKARETLQKRNRSYNCQADRKAPANEERATAFRSSYDRALAQIASPAGGISAATRSSLPPSTTEMDRSRLAPPQIQTRPASQSNSAAKRPSKVFALRQSLYTPASPKPSRYTPDWLKTNSEPAERSNRHSVTLPPLVNTAGEDVAAFQPNLANGMRAKPEGGNLLSIDPTRQLSPTRRIAAPGHSRRFEKDSPPTFSRKPKPTLESGIDNRPRLEKTGDPANQKPALQPRGQKRVISEPLAAAISYLTSSKPRTLRREQNTFQAGN